MSRRSDSKYSIRQFIQRLGGRTNRANDISSGVGEESDGLGGRYATSFSNCIAPMMSPTRGRSFLPRAQQLSVVDDDGERDIHMNKNCFVDVHENSPVHSAEEQPECRHHGRYDQQGHEEGRELRWGSDENTSCDNTDTLINCISDTHSAEGWNKSGELCDCPECAVENAAASERSPHNEGKEVSSSSHQRRKHGRSSKEE